MYWAFYYIFYFPYDFQCRAYIVVLYLPFSLISFNFIENRIYSFQVIIFNSLGTHYRNTRRLIADTAPCDTVIVCEPMTRYLEVNRTVSVYQLQNLSESLQEETARDRNFSLELVRFCTCHLQDSHVVQLQDVVKHAKRLDLNGNAGLSAKAYGVLSSGLLSATPFRLTHLNLSNCRLAEAHIIALVPLFVRLEELDLSYNEDMAAREMRTISDAVTAHATSHETQPSLNKLVLAGCNMTAEHVKQLYRCIPLLEHLDLSQNNMLSAYAITILSDAILERAGKPTRREALTLRFEHCQMTDSHIENLCGCIHLLKELDLSWNELSIEGVQMLTEALHETKGDLKLDHLMMMGCELGEKHLAEIASTVIYLESLNIGYNPLSCSDCLRLVSEHIYAARKRGRWCPFRTLHLGVMEILDASECDHVDMGKISMDMLGLNPSSRHGRKRLGKTLDFLASLEELNLCGNTKFSHFSAATLSDTIVRMNDTRVDCFLRKLNLSNCNLMDVHIEKLLPCVVFLVSLDLSSNPRLTPGAMKILSNCILDEGDNLLLQNLNLSSCGLSDSHVKSLDGCYTSVKSVNITKNKLTEESMQLILGALDRMSKSRRKVSLRAMTITQAFSARDYCYRKFEISARIYNVDMISMNI